MQESSSEMDTIEFWIWEHATKYGMTKVLTKMKEKSSSFTYITPNSWLSALYLRQIKNEWSELDSKISPKEINALKETLTSTFKHYKEDLNHFIKTSVCIQLDLYCKAAFLVMRSKEANPSVKSQVRDKLFPCWNMDMWTKMKNSFGLKDDLIMEEIKQFYLEMRLKLCQVDQQKKILDQFGDMMKKHFPSLISFMQKIKLSRLERIQLNKMKLDKQYEFLRVILNDGLVNELVVLDLLEDVQRKKIIESALEFLKEVKMDEATTDTSSCEIKIYTLPPEPDSKFENNDDQIYPACFLRNPFMSTEIAVKNDAIIEEMVIDRNIPLKPDGKDFGPLWFSDTRLLITKMEKNGLSNEHDSFKITENFPVALSTYNNSISDHSIKTAAPDGLTNEKQSSPITSERNSTKRTVDNDGGTNFEKCNPQLISKVSIIGTERVNLIQSWINNNPLDSHSSFENGINELYRKETLPLSSEIIENCKLPFDKIVSSVLLAPVLNRPSSEDNLDANSSKLKKSECRPSDGALTEYESSERWIPPSDTEYVSSTAASSTSSRRRMQTRTRYKHLAELANREKRKEAENHRLVEDGDETDDSISLNYRLQRRLRSQSAKPNEGSIPVQVARSKKKCRKLSSSSSSSGYSANSKILQRDTADVGKIKTSGKSKSEESSTENRKKQLGDRSNGTPPLDEHSNLQNPDQQNSKCSKENNALEFSALRTGIKRKLDLYEQPISDSPKSKRVPVEKLPGGKRILPNIVETLKKHSEQLLLNDPFFSKHCKKLDLCIQHVLRSHQKMSQSDDNEASTRVKTRY